VNRSDPGTVWCWGRSACWAASHGAAILDASLVNIALVQPSGQSLRVWHDPALPEEVTAPFRVLQINEITPLTDAVATNAPVMVGHLTQLALRYPRLISASAAVGVEASATMPLRTSAGQVIGALGVTWTRPLDFDDTQRAMLESLSGLCAQTIERRA